MSLPTFRDLLPSALAAEALEDLAARPLAPQHQALLDAAASRCEGSECWQRRKLTEAHALLSLVEIAPPGRLFLLSLDLATELKAHIHLSVPVPVSLPGHQIETVRHARILHRMPQGAEEAFWPGNELITLTFPGHDVWHPCVAWGYGQRVAIAERIPACTTLVEMILGTYEVLSLRAFAADPWNCRGVLNPTALAWWQQHLHRVPLTSRPFFANDAPSS